MLSRINKYLLFLLCAILAARLFPMIMIPFADPTEARYGEVARIMMETGDWITPYFNYDVPFWGKPPLSFWMQALSFKLFGLHEFAPRFPSWLLTIIIAGLIYYLTRHIASQNAAILASLIYTSCMLVFALSGAVLTDPYLTLAVTFSLVSFILIPKQRHGIWRYGFFIGLALGMLSKGPIAVILIAGPIGIWLLLAKHRWRTLKLLPWFTGTLLTLVITLPWYIAAEIKTPGFIEYFIVGEHFYRFVDPGWSGDLYGSAHKHPKGTIWILWLAASLPWGLVALALVAKNLVRTESRTILRQKFVDDDVSFYVLWAIFPMCFFSLAGNVLWTYALPALPPLAILLALYFARTKPETESHTARWVSLGALVSPIFLLAATLYVVQHPEIVPTEKHLVQHFRDVAPGNEKLFFVDKRSFSARYYSQGAAELLSVEQLKERIQGDKDLPEYVALPEKQIQSIQTLISRPMSLLFQSNKFQLFKIENNKTETMSGSINPQ